jgi:hypothetical protein
MGSENSADQAWDFLSSWLTELEAGWAAEWALEDMEAIIGGRQPVAPP